MARRFLLALVPLFAACAIESTSPTSDPGDRGGLGKADVVGSCQYKHYDLCGGPGVGNCWCDEACVDYGDCCSDAEEVCGIEPAPEEGNACGGKLNPPCGEGEFCMWETEEMCGAADHLGECVVQPEICNKLLAPVCGCDGQTYSNACFAHAAGTSVVSEGECEPVAQFCGGFANLPCPDGFVCGEDPNDGCDPENGGADCGGICVPAPSCEPVLCELFCENGFATDADGCEVCSCAEVADTCGPIENDYATELAEIRACTEDSECGQVLVGTSCGCTRNLVARNDADLADYEEIRTKAQLNECDIGGFSTCDCPAADGFACDAGVCTWNYTNG